MSSSQLYATQTHHLRRQHVSKMRVSFALEGLEPNSDDLANHQMYIDGKISLDDMLTYARNFAISSLPGKPRSP
jgi:hypothetical protein